MTKPLKSEFSWHRAVPEILLEGCKMDKWDEETSDMEFSCMLKVDEYGFFLSWQSEGRDAMLIDLSYVTDVRRNCVPKDFRVYAELEAKGKGSLEDRTLILTSVVNNRSDIGYTYFAAPDPPTAKKWSEALNEIIHNFKMHHINFMDMLLKEWTRFILSVNEKGKVPMRLFYTRLACGRNDKQIHGILQEAHFPTSKNDDIDVKDLSFEKFYAVMNKAMARQDIFELFKSISRNKDYLTVQQLIEFLNDKQRDPRLNEILFPHYDEKRVISIIDKYERNEDLRRMQHLSNDGFTRYLMSDENAPVFLDRIDVYMDMDQPLAHYLINSSHNTYLSGRQFGGKSVVEMYKQVLLSGCRCVELDCWDGKGDDQEPIITHGKAMCTDILFKDAIIAINETAFVVTDFPVILSFENHCSKLQQYKMGKYCEEIFGDSLLKDPLPSHPLEPGVPLPSPAMLKGKILIKNKRLKPEVEKRGLELLKTVGVISEEGDDQVDGEDATAVVNEPKPGGPGDEAHPEADANKRKTKEKEMSQEMDEAAFQKAQEEKDRDKEVKLRDIAKKKGKNEKLNEDEEALLVSSYQYTGATTNIHPVLSAMINYMHPVKFSGWDVAAELNIFFHMSSFNENTGLGLIKANPIEFVNYNKRQISRIYPKGQRVDSSNFIPQIYWNVGIQMVALNFQTPDVGMQLNEGKFEYNGACGYLLKPDFMRRPDRQFDPFSDAPVDGVIAAYCAVQVVSGLFLSDKKIGTYVEVDMYGLPTDTIRKEFRTRLVPANGLNPVYNEDKFVFRKVVLPDLAVLHFRVCDESGKQIGQRVLPLDGLQAGYRHISLRTDSNFPLGMASLFCYIQLRTYVPDGFSDFVDALSDPRAFIGQQEKRAQAISDMGIDESEIEDVTKKYSVDSVPAKLSTPNVSKLGRPKSASALSNKADGATNQASQGATVSAEQAHSVVAKPSVAGFEAVSIEGIKRSREYAKLVKKQAEELEAIKKAHNKAMSQIQKSQYLAIEKNNLVATKSSEYPSPLNGRPKKISIGSKSASNKNLELTPVNPGELRKMIASHAEEVTKLTENHMKSQHGLITRHVDAQCELLKKMVQLEQEEQVKQLNSRHQKDAKELKASQAKESVTASKSIMADKKIKSKTEKDRRVKELNSNNTKRFIEERRRLAMKQSIQMEALKKQHSEQAAELETETKKVLEQTKLAHIEETLAFTPRSIV